VIQSNVLIGDDGEALLCDFGRSRITGHRGFTSLVLGTLVYQAPELIQFVQEPDTNEEVRTAVSPVDKEIYNDKLTTKTDVYAYAMVTVEVSLKDSQRKTRKELDRSYIIEFAKSATDIL
jgi:serine/threonine protein kinase